MQARGLMSLPVVTVPPDDTVGHAAEAMLEHNISALPVLDDDRKLVGIPLAAEAAKAYLDELKKQRRDEMTNRPSS